MKVESVGKVGEVEKLINKEESFLNKLDSEPGSVPLGGEPKASDRNRPGLHGVFRTLSTIVSRGSIGSGHVSGEEGKKQESSGGKVEQTEEPPAEQAAGAGGAGNEPPPIEPPSMQASPSPEEPEDDGSPAKESNIAKPNVDLSLARASSDGTPSGEPSKRQSSPTPTDEPTPKEPPQEFTQIEELGYSIPEIPAIPSYEHVVAKIEGRDPVETPPIFILEDLAYSPVSAIVNESDFISAAREALRRDGFPPAALDYATTVALPVLMALHADHASEGYADVVTRFVEKVGKSEMPHTVEQLTSEIAQAIDFVAQRPEKIRQVHQIFTDWMQENNAADFQSPIVGIVVFGSYIRGNATYISDVDLLLISDGAVSEADYQQFVSYGDERLQEIAPSSEGVGIWSGSTFPLDEDLRDQLEARGVETDWPGFHYKIFAADRLTEELIQAALTPEKDRIMTEPATFYSLETLDSMSATILKVPQGDPRKITRIKVNGEELNTIPGAVRALGRTLQHSDQLINAGKAVDGNTFATMLGGGIYYPQPREAYTVEHPDDAYYYHFMEPTSRIGDDVELPPMEPLGLTVPNPDGTFTTLHMIVKLPITKGSDVYVSKLGEGPEAAVALTDLDSIAEFYGATHVGPLGAARVVKIDTGEPIIEYGDMRYLDSPPQADTATARATETSEPTRIRLGTLEARFSEFLGLDRENPFARHLLRGSEITMSVRHISRPLGDITVSLGGKFDANEYLDSLDVTSFEHSHSRDPFDFDSFISAMQTLSRLSPWPILYLENVSDPRIVAWCQQNGWKLDVQKQTINKSPSHPSFYIKLPREKK